MSEDVVGRLAVVAIIAVVAFLYPRDMRRYRSQWPRRARRITWATLIVFIALGFSLLYAAQVRLDFIWPIYLVGASFALLGAALLYAPADDNDAPPDG